MSSSGSATSPDTLHAAYEGLLKWFSAMRSVVVAFSGGVDSCLVLKAAVDSLGPDRVLAVTADSPSLPRDELRQAQQLARSLQVQHTLLPTQELDNPSYAANLGDRCYFCKSTLYESLMELLAVRQLGSSEGRVLVDGTNLDDLSDVRPGAKAAREAGVRHPLVELQLTKDAVRQLSRFCGLPTWDKPAMACLSSRIPAGVEVSAEKLAMIEDAEAELKKLGFRHVRVRYHELKGLQELRGEQPLTLARIELAREEIPQAVGKELRARVAQAVRRAGFALVTIDLEGYRRGGAA